MVEFSVSVCVYFSHARLAKYRTVPSILECNILTTIGRYRSLHRPVSQLPPPVPANHPSVHTLATILGTRHGFPAV